MSSDSLQRLRSLAKEQTRLYQSHRKETANITELYAEPYKTHLLTKLVDKTQGQLAALSQRRQAAMADVTRRAASRTAKATPEGRAKVADALANGFDYHSLMSQLVAEGDKEGLASLKAYLPYAHKAGRLPGKADDPKVLEQAYKSLETYDAQLWDEGEKRWNGEAYEAAQSHPLMEWNEQQLEGFLKNQLNPHAPQQLKETLFHWQGTNQNPSPTRGKFDPNTYRDLED